MGMDSSTTTWCNDQLGVSAMPARERVLLVLLVLAFSFQRATRFGLVRQKNSTICADASVRIYAEYEIRSQVLTMHVSLIMV